MCKIVAQAFFILILAGAAIPPVFLSPEAEAALNEPAPDEGKAIIGVVSAFYDKYLKQLDAQTELLDWLRQQPEVDAALVEEIEKLFKEVEDSEEGFLGYDPILVAQDIPESMQYSRPVIDGASAELIAYTLWGGDSKSPLCVTLAKKKNAWLITGILDMAHEEERACGGMKPGGRSGR